MAKHWGEIGSSLWRRGRQLFPIVVSTGVLTWLVWHITPARLFAAFSQVNWPWLVVATAVQVIVLFLWDSVCVWWLFSQPAATPGGRHTICTRYRTGTANGAAHGIKPLSQLRGAS